MPNYNDVPDDWKPAVAEAVADVEQEIMATNWEHEAYSVDISPVWKDGYQSKAQSRVHDGGTEKYYRAVVEELRHRGHNAKLLDDGDIEVRNPLWRGKTFDESYSAYTTRTISAIRLETFLLIVMVATSPFLWWVYLPLIAIYMIREVPAMWRLWMFLCSLPYAVVGVMYLAMVR